MFYSLFHLRTYRFQNKDCRYCASYCYCKNRGLFKGIGHADHGNTIMPLPWGTEMEKYNPTLQWVPMAVSLGNILVNISTACVVTGKSK